MRKYFFTLLILCKNNNYLSLFNIMTTIERNYNVLRKKLDSAGYHQSLSFDSIDLVDNLLNDVLHCKSENTVFKDLVNELFQQLGALKFSQRPLRREHKNLKHENSFINSQVIHEGSDFQELIKDLKLYISEFQKSYTDLELVNLQHIIRICKLEEEILLQNKKLMKYEGAVKHVKGTASFTSHKSNKKRNEKKIKLEENGYYFNDISSINHYVSSLYSSNGPCGFASELEKVKAERINLTNLIELYRNKIRSHDEEIKRLPNKLEKNPTSIISNPVCKCHFSKKKFISPIKSEAGNHVTRIDKLKQSKFSSNKNKTSDKHKENLQIHHKSTQTQTTSTTIKSDKWTDLKAERTEKSCQTLPTKEGDSDYKYVGEIEEQNKNKSHNLIQSHVNHGEKEIVSLQCACEKIKAERNYYCKEYHLLQERIYQLFIEKCSSTAKGQTPCINSTKDCQGDCLRLLINRIEKLLRSERTGNFKEEELKDMVATLQKEKAVLLQRCDSVEQKIKEIKKFQSSLIKHFQNISPDKSKFISDYNCLQEYLVKKDEELKSAISTKQKVEVQLNNTLLNLVALSTENDCLKDKVKQKDDHSKKMEKDLVSQANYIKTLSESQKTAEAEVKSLRKKNSESEKEMKGLKQELCRSSYKIERISKENDHLMVTIGKLKQHIRHLHQDLDQKKHRINDLKREAHRYISEVRRVEETIESKELNLQRILEIYNVVSDEETFSSVDKRKETLEVDENFVTEYFENINRRLNDLELADVKDDAIQDQREKEEDV